MPDLIILRGVPGAGKSTVATLFNGETVSKDDFLLDEQGKYFWTRERSNEAHAKTISLAHKLMKSQEPTVVIANTNTTNDEVDFWSNIGRLYGYKIFVIVIENRHGGKDVHNVPADYLNLFEGNLKNSIQLRS